MKHKKIVAFLLVLVLAVGFLPVQVFAQGTGQGSLSGRHSVTMSGALAAAATADGPSLAEGNHERWVDRIADPPQYALDFYAWLEDNIDGALIDPSQGELVSGANVYCLHTIKRRTDFTYTGTGHKAAAEAAAVADLGEDHLTVVNYAGAMFGAFDRDHPEVFWLSGNALYGYTIEYDYTYLAGRGTVDYEVDIFSYLSGSEFDLRNVQYRDVETLRNAIAEQDAIIERIVAAAPTTSAYDQLAYFNQVLVDTNCYNSAVAEGQETEASVDAWKSISALRGSTGVDGPVCEGYARAYMLLCKAAGIPCVLVQGPAAPNADTEAIGHMWNYVQLDGQWYAVDSTWNDPYSRSKPTVAKSGYECDDWFLLGKDTQITSDMTFGQSHVETNYSTKNSLSYINGPVLSSEAYTPSLTPPTLSLRYPSLSFEDVIVLNIYYSAENLENVSEMGLITYSEEPADYGMETAESVIAGYGISESDGLYFSSTAGIAPKNIGDTIYFAVYAKLTDGTYVYTNPAHYSPKTYAVNLLTGGNEEMKPLVVAMLNYGAAAQSYFGYNTDSLMNSDLTEAQKGLVEDYRDDMIAAVTKAAGEKLGTMVNNGGYIRCYPTISFEGAFCINYYFVPSAAPVGDVTMYIWSLEDFEAADSLSKENATKAVQMELADDGSYFAAVDGIAAKDLDKAVYVSFCHNDGAADYCNGVTGYTIGLYCKAQAASAGALAELAAACGVYGYYAKQLFGKTE